MSAENVIKDYIVSDNCLTVKFNKNWLLGCPKSVVPIYFLRPLILHQKAIEDGYIPDPKDCRL